MSETVLDQIVACLRAASAYNPNAQHAPVALLWPDEGAQWKQVIDQIAERYPLVMLGDYEPGHRRGPAYWIRCAVAGTVDVQLADGIPVVYLPGVARSALRAVDNCPQELAPIAELQHRSLWFAPPGGRTWSVRALLSNADRGLGLRIHPDAETGDALLLALTRLLDERVDGLTGQLLDADFFHELISPDPIRNLLGWLDDPPGYPTRLGGTQWSAFVQQSKRDFGLDPARDGPVTAAERLGRRDGTWAKVWERFVEAPRRYPGIPDRLRRARPMVLSSEEGWPQDNEDAEGRLRDSLLKLAGQTPQQVREAVHDLEEAHVERRAWVWADLDQAPLAFAIEQLALLAELTTRTLNTSDLNSMIGDYASWGWRVDDTVLRALAAAPEQRDRQAVSIAASALYRTWIDLAARRLQAAIGPMANAKTYVPGSAVSVDAGTVAVFVDGLRLDIAHRLQDRLAAGALSVELTTELAALPTVTPTAKAALVPIVSGSLVAGPELYPANAVSGTRATTPVLRTLMTENGVQILGSTETGNPAGTAWTEAGELDRRGHEAGARLVDILDDEVDRIVGRIRALLDAGWKRVVVVTDHGWVLLPGGLEKVDLPVATTDIKKGRCARLKPGAIVSIQTVPWFWDQDVRIALAPGVTCFEAGKEYEHGGVSPQECIVPRLTIEPDMATRMSGTPEITTVKWLGLLCRIELSGVGEGVTVDLRGLPADPSTSIAEKAQETSSFGRVSLLVPDEEHQGERAHVVLVDAAGQIVAQREVAVGSNQ